MLLATRKVAAARPFENFTKTCHITRSLTSVQPYEEPKKDLQESPTPKSLQHSTLDSTPNLKDLGKFELSLVRRSPAASYGATYFGRARVPSLVQNVINSSIRDLPDKKKMRTDVQYLYKHIRTHSGSLDRILGRPEQFTIPIKYDHGRTLAYASGIMPGHFSATVKVFREVHRRLSCTEEAWRPTHIVDWGSGTGSVAWAGGSVWHDYTHYIGLDSSTAPQMFASKMIEPLKGIISTKLYKTNILNLFEEFEKQNQEKPSLAPNPKNTLAVASFTLSELRDAKSRRQMLKNMWDSGAEVIVLIENGNPRGFDIIEEARDYLLHIEEKKVIKQNVDPEDYYEVGRDIYLSQEYLAQNSRDDLPWTSHVVAPCPHDKECAVARSRVRFCHFSQPFEAPMFYRKTKLINRGSDMTNYSYVVIRRSKRPKRSEQSSKATNLLSTNWRAPTESPATPLYASGFQSTSVGNAEEIFNYEQDSQHQQQYQEDNEKEKEKEKEKAKEEEKQIQARPVELTAEKLLADMKQITVPIRKSKFTSQKKKQNPPAGTETQTETKLVTTPLAQRWDLIPPHEQNKLIEHMQTDANSWARIVQSPKKGHDHVTLDVCSADHGIERLIVTKAQGKQAYYDARKAQWGDAFVHEAKVRDYGKRHRDRERKAASGQPKSVRAERLRIRNQARREYRQLDAPPSQHEVMRRLEQSPQPSPEELTQDDKQKFPL